MNIYSLPDTIALAVNIALGLAVLSNAPKRAANRLFLLLVSSMAIWNVGEILMINARTQGGALLGAKLVLVGIFMFPVFFSHFTFVFPRRISSRWSPLTYPVLFYALPGAMLTFVLLTLQVKAGQTRFLNDVFLAFHGQTMGFYAIYLAIIGVFLSYGVSGIINLIFALKTTSIIKEKLQIRYLIFGMVLVGLFGVVVDLLNFLLRLGYPSFFLTGLYTIILSIFFSIAIIKYRLLDIEVIIRRSILFSALSVLILTIYVLVIKHLSDWLGATTQRESIVVESLFVLILVILSRPLKDHTERMLDRVFFPKRVASQKRMLEFSKTLVHSVDLDGLLEQLVAFVEETFIPSRIALLFRDEAGERYTVRCARHLEGNVSLHRPLLEHWFAGKEDVIQIENLDRNADDEIDWGILERLNISLLVPFRLQDVLWGCLMLGKRRNGATWEVQDMDFLHTLANQVDVAISRALIYEKEQRRERQLLQTEKLAALGTLSAGMAHEMRNPLNIISGSAETLKNGRLNQEEEKEMLAFIMDETDRLNGIVTRFLDFARPRTPEIRRCDVLSLVDETLQMLSERAKKANVAVVKKYPKSISPFDLDPEQLKQILINLALNALEAMGEAEAGTLTAKVAPKEDDVVISIKDTGVGIPKKIQSKIFDPFFTTKEKGTGLGLSMTHRMVDGMGGTLSFVSAPGKGTTFTLTIPKFAPESQSPRPPPL